MYELAINLGVLAICLATAGYLIAARRDTRPSRSASLLTYALGLSFAAFVAWIGVLATWAYSIPVLVAFLGLLAAAALAWLTLVIALIGRAVSR